ncbi:MAG: UDP-N-acetylmuramoyl-tripeptide--D-alanyl-D-alanine ligase [Synechococcales cyanobacterium]
MISGTWGTVVEWLQPRQWQGDPALPFRGVETDSRQMQPGSLFVALAGETFDGHRFIPQAMQRGAVGVITAQPDQTSGDYPYVQVSDTLVAYQALARRWRQQFRLPLVGITGSAGKTSTKEMLAAALGRFGPVLKSQANHNNDIGVAHTLVHLGSQHQFAVVEMAMRGRGEIARLTEVAQPTHALITNVGTAHIGRLGSREAIAKAKCELLAGLSPEGVAILNGEDPRLLQTAATVWANQTLTYGLTQGEIRGEWDPEQQTVTVAGIPLPVPLPGRHQALNWMGVIATVQTLGLDLERLRDPIDLPAETAGRNRRFWCQGRLILDESYNAAPEAMVAALHLLANTPATRRLAVLGPMRELGDFADEVYAHLASVLAQLALDQVVVLDPAQEMPHLPASVTFRDPESLIDYLGATSQPGDVLLFKAAHSIGLDRVVQSLADRLLTSPKDTP